MTILLDKPQTLLIDVSDHIATVTLNRPRAKNAMNFKMIAELYTLFSNLHGNRDVRAIVLKGAESTFCAGGDIKEMRENAVPATEQAGNLDAMLRAANEASQVVIAQVEGAALGGGMGLVCVSDIAIADENALFGLPEVRLGIAPSFISPYVLTRIGLTRARELMLTGRRFGGREALDYGIVHECCTPDALDGCLERTLRDIRLCPPGAIAAIKQLLFRVHDQPPETTLDFRSELLNRLRAGDEAQEGMMAFLQKRQPNWVNEA